MEHNQPKYIISLTTYYDRFQTAHLAIGSLLAQKSAYPFAVHLYLIENQIKRNGGVIPPQIEALAEKGLKIFVRKEDHRSYNKLLFALRENPGQAIVTADDDVFYPDSLLERMAEKSAACPGAIVCNCGYMLSFDRDGRFRPYYELLDIGEDADERRTSPSFRLFPVGVGAVLYPAGAIDDIVFDSGQFSGLCPHGDDIWFKTASLKKGTKCVQTDSKNIVLQGVEERQRGSLANVNVNLGLNDRQFAACFERYPNLLDKLKREFADAPDYALYDDWVSRNSRNGMYGAWVFKYFLYKSLAKLPSMKTRMSLKAEKYARRLVAARLVKAGDNDAAK